MTDETNNSSAVTTGSTGSTGSGVAGAVMSRRSLWLVGGVFWVLVIVAAYFVGERRIREMRAVETAEQDRLSGGVVMLTNDGAGGSGDASKVLVPGFAKDENSNNWDPAGVADFEFTDMEGKRVTKQNLLGKPWIVCFIFTRCEGPCRTISLQMSRLQDFLVGKDVKLVSITVDPKYDTPQVLKRYSEQFNAEPGQWTYLSGDRDQTYRLIRDSFKMPVKEMVGADRKPGWEVLHSSNILLVDAQGRVVDKYNGIDDGALARLRRDVDAEIAKSRQSAAGAKTASGPVSAKTAAGRSEPRKTTAGGDVKPDAKSIDVTRPKSKTSNEK